MLVPISNDFHNTETKIRFPKGMPEIFITEKQAKRIGSRLCCSDCSCSGVLGARGAQTSFEHKGESFHIEWEGFMRGSEFGYILAIVAD